MIRLSPIVQLRLFWFMRQLQVRSSPLIRYRAGALLRTTTPAHCFFTPRFQVTLLYGAAMLCLAVPWAVLAQDGSAPAVALSPSPLQNSRQVQTKQPVESDIITEGFVSYGHYRIFASGEDYHLYGSGFEYDRNSWGRFLGAHIDYSAEFLPILLLNTAVSNDIWGSPATTNRTIVPGMGISPIGFRMVWRGHKSLMPYLSAKGGVIGFTQKVLSQKSTYEYFSLQSGTGLLVKMNDRFDLRLGLFNDFHFSNGFITPVNPGLDVMNANLGISYRIGSGRTNIH